MLTVSGMKILDLSESKFCVKLQLGDWSVHHRFDVGLDHGVYMWCSQQKSVNTRACSRGYLVVGKDVAFRESLGSESSASTDCIIATATSLAPYGGVFF